LELFSVDFGIDEMYLEIWLVVILKINENEWKKELHLYYTLLCIYDTKVEYGFSYNNTIELEINQSIYVILYLDQLTKIISFQE